MGKFIKAGIVTLTGVFALGALGLSAAMADSDDGEQFGKREEIAGQVVAVDDIDGDDDTNGDDDTTGDGHSNGVTNTHNTVDSAANVNVADTRDGTNDSTRDQNTNDNSRDNSRDNTNDNTR